jgi:hypothetical protein
MLSSSFKWKHYKGEIILLGVTSRMGKNHTLRPAFQRCVKNDLPDDDNI